MGFIVHFISLFSTPDKLFLKAFLRKFKQNRIIYEISFNMTALCSKKYRDLIKHIYLIVLD
jgi:hypothetical protein